MTRFERALGALTGLALGDALGMPTQSLSRAAIVARYGSSLDGFEPGGDDQPIAAGLPAGRVTDDTEQALLLAELLVEGAGHIDGRLMADRLLAWEDDMRARGSLDLLGPSTRRSLDALLGGASIDDSGRFGATNGAAMRITPVGIAVSTDDLGRLVALVVEASRVTHNTGLGLAGAAAVAGAVSAGVQGATVSEATGVAIEVAERAGKLGHYVAGADVAERIRWAVGLGKASGTDDVLLGSVYGLVGTSLAAQESIPAAFALLAAVPEDPWRVCCLGASLGGDTDTIAAMAGAIAGACHGVDAFPAAERATVIEVNGLDLEPLTRGLLALRDGACSG